MTNRIPLSLDRPFLRDAFVEFRFSPRVSPDLLPGIFYERLRGDGWQPPFSGKGDAVALGYHLTASARQMPFLDKGPYRLYILEGSVYFNITQGYQGWTDSYFPLLTETVSKILDSSTLNLNRVSLRYVNDLPDVDVFKLTKSFSPPSISIITPQGQTVRFTGKIDDITTILHLTSDVPSTNKSSAFSVIDISLQRVLKEEEQNVEVALQLVQALHDINKEILFGELIPEDFIANFGPTYS